MAPGLVKLGASPPFGQHRAEPTTRHSYVPGTYVRTWYARISYIYDIRAYHLRTYVRHAHDLLAEDLLLALSMKLPLALVGGHHGEALGGVLTLLRSPWTLRYPVLVTFISPYNNTWRGSRFFLISKNL